MSKALDLFTAIPKLHNCAQAVAASKGASAEEVAKCAAFGGGRAPEGLCGALYAAMLFAPEDKRQKIADDFQAALGETHCKALKAMGVPCTKCVETADK